MLGDWTGRNGTCRGTLGGRKWRSNARLEPFATPSRARDVLGLPFAPSQPGGPWEGPPAG